MRVSHYCLSPNAACVPSPMSAIIRVCHHAFLPCGVMAICHVHLPSRYACTGHLDGRLSALEGHLVKTASDMLHPCCAAVCVSQTRGISHDAH